MISTSEVDTRVSCVSNDFTCKSLEVTRERGRVISFVQLEQPFDDSGVAFDHGYCAWDGRSNEVCRTLDAVQRHLIGERENAHAIEGVVDVRLRQTLLGLVRAFLVGRSTWLSKRESEPTR